MSPATKEPRRERTRRTLEVDVRIKSGKPGKPRSIHVKHITLTDSIGAVVWRCSDLPRGASLQIIFPDDRRGPFFSLKQSSAAEVTGVGNRGEDDTLERYVYTVRINGMDPVLEDTETMDNHAIEVYDPPSPHDPLPEDPPK